MVATPVKVNVYDLGEFNGYISWMGVGVFHSGVEVYGKEYAFGGAQTHDHGAAWRSRTPSCMLPSRIAHACKSSTDSQRYLRWALASRCPAMGTLEQRTALVDSCKVWSTGLSS